ncbi:MAG TPA: hypothetical protein VEI95_14880 [Acidobacteriota bacterium]|nr:hypothetical protein [Acidobacteriota bacterium]
MAQKKKVMIIEDNPDCGEILAAMIRLMDYEVIFPGGNAANETADAIVVYLDFPRMRTVQMIRTLREDSMSKGIPIVAFIPWAYDDGATAARNAGADDVITGPITMEALRTGIAKYAPDTSEDYEPTIDSQESTAMKHETATEAINLDVAEVGVS